MTRYVIERHRVVGWRETWELGDGEDWPTWVTDHAAIEAVAGTCVDGLYRVREEDLPRTVVWSGSPYEAELWLDEQREKDE